jgi:hypothetical protein
LIVDGATRVTLTGFTIQNSPNSGVLARRFSPRCQISPCDTTATGIAIGDHSTAEIRDCTACHTRFGLDIYATPSVVLSGTFVTAQNARDGVDVFGAYVLELRGAHLQATARRRREGKDDDLPAAAHDDTTLVLVG